jgi:hypothetical protein
LSLGEKDELRDFPKRLNVRCNRDRGVMRWSSDCHAVSAKGLQSLALG